MTFDLAQDIQYLLQTPLKPVRFDGSFRRDSIFKGPPSRATDEAWDRLIGGICDPMS